MHTSPISIPSARPWRDLELQVLQGLTTPPISALRPAAAHALLSGCSMIAAPLPHTVTGHTSRAASAQTQGVGCGRGLAAGAPAIGCWPSWSPPLTPVHLLLRVREDLQHRLRMSSRACRRFPQSTKTIMRAFFASSKVPSSTFTTTSTVCMSTHMGKCPRAVPSAWTPLP